MTQTNWSTRFAEVVRRKAAAAVAARLVPLATVDDSPLAAGLPAIGTRWTRHYYDGPFSLTPLPAALPRLSLVFVQSRDGNTGAANPGDLGGGPTDLHLIYEGLSRVAADAVLAGARTAIGAETLFSTWHPEIVALRTSLHLPRHPAQIVVSAEGRLDLDGTLLFNVPEVPVIVLAGAGCRARCAAALRTRPWIRIVPIEGEDWSSALRILRQDHGISRISVIGGRATATSLIEAGVAQEVLLTTTSRRGGEPGTPYYAGTRPPRLRRITAKRGLGDGGPITVEHSVTEDWHAGT
jgi:riboflavin biosynthesis pyrimidine reductase